jgi:uroporphyrinogen-III synthase
LGCLSELVGAMRNRVAPVCDGPVTAAPLCRLGIPTTHPERYRFGALARLITDEIPSHAGCFNADGHMVSLRSGGVTVDGQTRVVTPTGMALLRRLMFNPGWVVSREELLAQLPGGSAHTHAVEPAISRLRSALGAPTVIKTVVKRGYRLAIDPVECHEP